MEKQSRDERELKQPSDEKQSQPTREKEVSADQQSSNEPEVEKTVLRQRRAEVQNPLMHESY